MLSPGLERGSGCESPRGLLSLSGELRDPSTWWFILTLCEALRIFEWEAAVRVWLAGGGPKFDVHCLAPWLLQNRGHGFGLVQGVKDLSQGS